MEVEASGTESKIYVFHGGWEIHNSILNTMKDISSGSCSLFPTEHSQALPHSLHCITSLSIYLDIWCTQEKKIWVIWPNKWPSIDSEAIVLVLIISMRSKLVQTDQLQQTTAPPPLQELIASCRTVKDGTLRSILLPTARHADPFLCLWPLPNWQISRISPITWNELNPNTICRQKNGQG